MFFDNDRKSRERVYQQDGRLPPGQSLTLKWPVLHEGQIPAFDPARWDFRVWGLVDNPLRLSWDEFGKLPQVRIRADFHCVTTWSKFDNAFEGARVTDLMSLVKVKPEAAFVTVHAYGGYTTNLPLVDLTDPDVLLAYAYEGKPLDAEHGGPCRLLVPRLYLWKSAKWVNGFEFTAKDSPGFWERAGYHMYGDPWKEERHGWNW